MPRQPDPKRQAKLKALEERRDAFRKWAPWFAVALLVLIVVLAAFGWMDWTSLNRAHAGEFGDFFGGSLNPILAFLSFIALLYTIVLQTDELATSREELELTRDELAASTEALKTQASYIERQNFEATFFQLIRLNHDIIGAMSYGPHTGRGALSAIASDTRQRMNNVGTGDAANTYRTEIFRRHGGTLLHYFKNLRVLIDHIEGIRETERNKYASIIRAQLSGDELLVLFYHAGFSRTGTFRDTISKYRILQGLKPNSFPHGQNLREKFGPAAFGLGLDVEPAADIGEPEEGQ